MTSFFTGGTEFLFAVSLLHEMTRVSTVVRAADVYFTVTQKWQTNLTGIVLHQATHFQNFQCSLG